MNRRLIAIPFCLIPLFLAFAGCASQDHHSSVDEIRQSVLGKDYDWVKEYLGKPAATASIDWCAPKMGATPEEAEAHYSRTVAKILIYKRAFGKFSVIFNANYIAIRVELVE